MSELLYTIVLILLTLGVTYLVLLFGGMGFIALLFGPKSALMSWWIRRYSIWPILLWYVKIPLRYHYRQEFSLFFPDEHLDPFKVMGKEREQLQKRVDTELQRIALEVSRKRFAFHSERHMYGKGSADVLYRLAQWEKAFWQKHKAVKNVGLDVRPQPESYLYR